MSDRPIRPTAEQLAHHAEQFNQSAILRHFGARLSFPSADRVRISLDDIKPEQRGGLGTSAVNGGVLAAMFDVAIGCTPALLDPTRRNATVQLSMSFERAVLGRSFYVEAKLDSAGKTLVFASAEIRDEKEQICAHCQGVVRISKEPWSSSGDLTITELKDPSNVISR
ncbi:MAG: PaaI family thioesterase [Myxococcaceae bacterium]